MNSNFKRHSNRLQCASMLRWVIVAAFLGVAGLSYVFLKNQIHLCGTQRKALESELTLIKAENNVMEARIAQLTSRAELQRKLNSGFIKLVPIAAQAVVRVRPSDREQQASLELLDDAIRPVSHDRRLSASR